MIRKVNVTLALSAMLLASSTAFGQARPTAKCETGKTKCVVNKVKGDLGCHGKAAKTGIAVDPNCLNKVQGKFSGTATSCIEKADAKNATVPCLSLNDGVPIGSKINALVANLKTTYYVSPPPNGINTCFTGQAKCATNYVKGIIGCYQKAVKGGLAVDGNCLNNPAPAQTASSAKKIPDAHPASADAGSIGIARIATMRVRQS